MNWNAIIPEVVWKGQGRHRLDNHELVERYATFSEKKASYQRKTARLKAALAIVLQKLYQEDFEIGELSRVSEIFQGVALDSRPGKNAYGKSFECSAVAWHIQRIARVWPLCDSNGTKWGMEATKSGQITPNGRIYSSPDYDDLVLKSKRWTAHGVNPQTGLVSMFENDFRNPYRPPQTDKP